MEAETRRQKILKLLSHHNPVTGKQLGEKFEVSRQVIVQDIALLRARGYYIIATPQGYINQSDNQAEDSYTFTIASKHEEEGIQEELATIVDLGGTILDVIVEHPIYGELKGQLIIKSRRDIQSFMNRLQGAKANPLSTLTEGIHLHTIKAPDREAITEIKNALNAKNFLVNDNKNH